MMCSAALRLYCKRVLCVDDEGDCLAVRKLLLERYGYVALVAASRAEALAIIAAQPVDVVLADYFLAGTTGEELAIEINTLCPNLPVIIYSGVVDLQIPAAAAVVQKPAAPETLVRVIERVIAARRKGPSQEMRPGPLRPGLDC